MSEAMPVGPWGPAFEFRGWKRRTRRGPDPALTERADDEPRGRRGRHRHGGLHGPGGPPFGPGGPGGRGWPGPWGGPPPRGRRRDRGDVRAAVLLLLAERSRHGYDIITELADRSDGRWRVSPGSVYPVLKRLTKEGLVTSTHEEDRRVFALTPEGEALVAEKKESWGEPWAQQDTDDDASSELWTEGRQLAGAVWQVTQSGDPALVEQTAAILTEARKNVYRLLAEQ